MAKRRQSRASRKVALKMKTNPPGRAILRGRGMGPRRQTPTLRRVGWEALAEKIGIGIPPIPKYPSSRHDTWIWPHTDLPYVSHDVWQAVVKEVHMGTVRTIDTREEALDRIRKAIPDVVLSATIAGGLDGLGLLDVCTGMLVPLYDALIRAIKAEVIQQWQYRYAEDDRASLDDLVELTVDALSSDAQRITARILSPDMWVSLLDLMESLPPRIRDIACLVLEGEPLSAADRQALRWYRQHPRRYHSGLTPREYSLLWDCATKRYPQAPGGASR
jgi:hypothetical protein